MNNVPIKNKKIFMLKYDDYIKDKKTFDFYVEVISNACETDFNNPNITIWLIDPRPYWERMEWIEAVGKEFREHTYKGIIYPKDIQAYNISKNGGYQNLPGKINEFSISKELDIENVYLHISCSSNDESISTYGLMIGRNALLNRYIQNETPPPSSPSSPSPPSSPSSPSSPPLPPLPNFNINSSSRMDTDGSVNNTTFWNNIMNGGSIKKRSKRSKITKKHKKSKRSKVNKNKKTKQKMQKKSRNNRTKKTIKRKTHKK